MNQDIDITRIKLVIWDLDNTFWQGVISEEQITLNNVTIDLVKKLNSKGIVNSICSKNDYEHCSSFLKEMGLWNLFVFPSIDWSLKGNRVFNIIKDMGLRPANVLYIDDERLNLENVLHIDDSIHVALPTDKLFGLLTNQLDFKKDDIGLTKLKQYRILETKNIEKKNFSSDRDFLIGAKIEICINKNCVEEVERIYELINKTNQLNFTKKRLTVEETRSMLLDDRYTCGYICCRDKYGYYGMIGFYAIKDGVLEHFLFSCRTIGMGIEEFVYNLLKCPLINIVQPVITNLKSFDENIEWITVVDSIVEDDAIVDSNLKILFKGPCDLSQVSPFINYKIDEEFTYVSDETKRRIEAHNHTISILESLSFSEKIKNELVEKLEIVDSNYFQTEIFSKKYNFVIFSLLVDYGLGLYQNNENPDIIIPYEQYSVDITNEKNWNKILNGELMAEVPLTKEFLVYFKEHYHYIGRISDDLLIKNIKSIKEKLGGCKLILLNGSEIPYSGKQSKFLFNRYLLHTRLNTLIYDELKSIQDIYIIDVTKIIESKANYLDTINHYKKNVYYRIADSILKIINDGSSLLHIVDESVMVEEERKQLKGYKRKKIKNLLVKIFSYKFVDNVWKLIKNDK